MNPSFLRAHLAIALGLTGATPKPREPDPEDPPPGLPPCVMVVGPGSPELDRRIIMGNDTIEVVHLTDAQVTDLIHRHDASNNPVDETPALPPRPEWDQVLRAFEPAAKDADRAMAQLVKVWPQPQSKRPPPCAGHSRLGRPVRVGGEARRPGTADAEKRAKRKAAEKSRRRNRR